MSAEASQRAHSGHCVRARNNIYRSPLWAPWKQSQYWSPKWTYTAVFIVRSLSIKIGGGEKQLFQHIPWHLSAYWLFCQSCVHLLECMGSENIRTWISLITEDNKYTEICPGDSSVDTVRERRATGCLINGGGCTLYSIATVSTLQQHLIFYSCHSALRLEKLRLSAAFNVLKFQGCYFSKKWHIGWYLHSGSLEHSTV